MSNRRTLQFLVCDENPHARRLVADVLSGAGYEKVAHAANGEQLLHFTSELRPNVVLTSSRIPGSLSGLDYTRQIRAGYGAVNRVTSIIVMTDTPTAAFLTAARDAGVDEMLVRPFNGQALLTRVEAVILRPRRFIDCPAYVGPCRRRRMLDEHGGGPQRRAGEGLIAAAAAAMPPMAGVADKDGPAWEADSNRALMRQCVARIAAMAQALGGDPMKLRDFTRAVQEAAQLADDMTDQTMGDSARSLLRYIGGMAGSAPLEADVLRTHVDAMQTLCVLGSAHQTQRTEVTTGLVAIVDKRIGRKNAAA
jgi:CheY-like chemotaxis protein